MERVTEVTGENEKKRSVKAGGFGFVSFLQVKEDGKSGLLCFLDRWKKALVSQKC